MDVPAKIIVIIASDSARFCESNVEAMLQYNSRNVPRFYLLIFKAVNSAEEPVSQ